MTGGTDLGGASMERGSTRDFTPVASETRPCQERVWPSLFSGFYVLEPLVLVVLTEEVWVLGALHGHIVPAGGPCTLGAVLRRRQWNERAEMVLCCSHSRTVSPWAYPVSSLTLVSLRVKWGK